MVTNKVDVLLVGGGVMSSTLGTLLNKIDPSLKITLAERLDQVAHESTDGWNNAGTGHAGNCELNYTPENKQGEVEVARALEINAEFEVSLQLWSALVESGDLPAPSNFIHPTPHVSFVWGKDNVEFLRQRWQKLSTHHLFSAMEFSEDPEVLRQWMPLVMNGRELDEPVAATKIAFGSDVDFGSLTRNLVASLEKKEQFNLLLNHEVKTFEQSADKSWNVQLKNRKTGKYITINAGFVFLGAGGGALPLLQKTGIPESIGYGGFPVSGQWLVCEEEAIVKQHYAKVYGKAAIGAPPMSVPHLDTRIINGKPALLFGPFAGFTTKFLKSGSSLDLMKSVRFNNLLPMIQVGVHNMDLTRYLISEVLHSHDQRVDALRNYFPQADGKRWRLAEAGQRVQIIKKDNKGRGKLEFGTELVSSKDHTLAALLGASPGASVSAHAMIDVIERCFSTRLDQGWQDRLKELVPSYGESLVENADLLHKIRPTVLSKLDLISD